MLWIVVNASLKQIYRYSSFLFYRTPAIVIHSDHTPVIQRIQTWVLHFLYYTPIADLDCCDYHHEYSRGISIVLCNTKYIDIFTLPYTGWVRILCNKLWQIVWKVILSKKCHMNIDPILNIYRPQMFDRIWQSLLRWCNKLRKDTWRNKCIIHFITVHVHVLYCTFS